MADTFSRKDVDNLSPSVSEVAPGSSPELSPVGVLLDRSRLDPDPNLGPLLQHCRAYLLDVANAEVPVELSVRIAPSDLVQETFVEAIRAFDQFRGRTEQELRGWLRRILLHNIADARRYFFETQKRQEGTLLPLQQLSLREQTGHRLVDPISSPSSIAQRSEISTKLRVAIDRLPEDYRLVMRLRHFEGLSLERVSEHLGRSTDAVRKLWFRGIEKLSELMNDDSAGG